MKFSSEQNYATLLQKVRTLILKKKHLLNICSDWVDKPKTEENKLQKSVCCKTIVANMIIFRKWSNVFLNAKTNSWQNGVKWY